MNNEQKDDNFIWLEKKMKNPCPFCGGKITFCFEDGNNNIKIIVRGQTYQAHNVWIVCHKCGSRVHKLHENLNTAVSAAIDLWETRV